DEELKSGDMTDMLAWWDKAIADHKAAGISYIVVPWMNTPATLADLQKQCDAFNEIGRRCAEQGLKFGYHNHSFEFNKIEDVPMLDYMIEHTDPANVLFEMDVYWAVIGDASPVDYFNKYPGRFKLLHIKDRREIGQSGMVGFDAIFNNADKAGLENFYVEIEEYSDGEENGAKQSADYLLNAGYVKPSYQAAAQN
ncbi:MAG: sugar phosphate isomerase/epimerase, partial [Muribaculaceae bacterium]|nr:sugar phosphate isomerase/epimerase [Muribaculaceae bacterium]